MSESLLTSGDIAEITQRVAQDIAADAARRDAERALPFDAMSLLRGSGLTALRVPRSHGGQQASYRQLTDLFVTLAKADPNVAQALIPHITTIERVGLSGDEALKTRVFASILHGELYGVANAELGGQYRGVIRTTLSRDGLGFRLNGRKFYSTGSLFAQHLRVSAVTTEGGRVTVLLPADRPGIRLLDDWDGMGQRLTASGTTEFDNVAVSAADILPSGGWHGASRDYTDAGVHLLHTAIEVGIGLAILRDVLAWAATGVRAVRESGVARAVEDPFIQNTVGQISTHAHAAEALTLRAAEVVDRAADAPGRGISDPAALEALVHEAAIAVSEAKVFASEAAIRLASQLYDVGGASTTRAGLNLDRHWRNARTHTTHDPLSYRLKAIGAYRLNGTPPPVGAGS